MKYFGRALGKEAERIPINSVEDLKTYGWDRIQCARCKWPKRLKDIAEAKGEAICKKCKEKEGQFYV